MLGAAWQPSVCRHAPPAAQGPTVASLCLPASLLPPTPRCPARSPAPPPAGTSQWPGANFILFPSGDKVFLKFGDCRRIASELKIGDIVERHLDSEWRQIMKDK